MENEKTGVDAMEPVKYYRIVNGWKYEIPKEVWDEINELEQKIDRLEEERSGGL